MQRCLVAYEENKQPEWLQKPLVLKDALSDLPAVSMPVHWMEFQKSHDVDFLIFKNCLVS